MNRVPARLRAPEPAARVFLDGTAGNGVFSGEGKTFLCSLPFPVLQQLNYFSPPDLFSIFGSPGGDNSEALSGRTKSQASGKTHCPQLLLKGRKCCRKGSGKKYLGVTCLQRKRNEYKEQTCFLRKTAPNVS